MSTTRLKQMFQFDPAEVLIAVLQQGGALLNIPVCYTAALLLGIEWRRPDDEATARKAEDAREYMYSVVPKRTMRDANAGSRAIGAILNAMRAFAKARLLGRQSQIFGEGIALIDDRGTQAFFEALRSTMVTFMWNSKERTAPAAAVLYLSIDYWRGTFAEANAFAMMLEVTMGMETGTAVHPHHLYAVFRELHMEAAQMDRIVREVRDIADHGAYYMNALFEESSAELVPRGSDSSRPHTATA